MQVGKANSAKKHRGTFTFRVGGFEFRNDDAFQEPLRVAILAIVDISQQRHWRVGEPPVFKIRTDDQKFTFTGLNTYVQQSFKCYVVKEVLLAGLLFWA